MYLFVKYIRRGASMILINKSKRGEKELQMIFGLFVLLIISLVVLMLFLKFTKNSTTSMKDVQGDFFSKSKINNAVLGCKELCSNIQGSPSPTASAIQFCSKVVKIDDNGDDVARPISQADFGQYLACEDKIPCFVLVPNCGASWNSGTPVFTGDSCRSLLEKYRPSKLEALMYDSPKGTCQLPVKGDPDAKANWVLDFGYYNTTKYNPDGTLH